MPARHHVVRSGPRVIAAVPWLSRVRKHKRGAPGSGPSFRPEGDDGVTPRRIQALAIGSVLGVGGLTWFGGSTLELARRPHDEPWFGVRGPLSSERAVAVLPTCLCVGSGIVAAAISRWFPSHVRHVCIGLTFHEMLSLPLSLLVAFRFQAAYDRWWTSRHSISDLAARTLSVAEYVAASVVPVEEGAAGSSSGSDRSEAAVEASELRSRFLAIAEAYICFAEERLHGCEFRPHPENVVEDWRPAGEALREWPKDAAAVSAASDPIVWCSTAMLAIVRRFQELEVMDGDNGSMLCANVMSLEQVLTDCMVKVEQRTPAPFIVHLRSVLLLFCFTLPFALMSTVSPALLVPMQSTVSFAFLGSEYCSLEMETPFGNAKSNIPVRKIVQEARMRIRQARHQEV